jgi:hypothetical protein
MSLRYSNNLLDKFDKSFDQCMNTVPQYKSQARLNRLYTYTLLHKSYIFQNWPRCTSQTSIKFQWLSPQHRSIRLSMVYIRYFPQGNNYQRDTSLDKKCLRGSSIQLHMSYKCSDQ